MNKPKKSNLSVTYSQKPLKIVGKKQRKNKPAVVRKKLVTKKPEDEMIGTTILRYDSVSAAEPIYIGSGKWYTYEEAKELLTWLSGGLDYYAEDRGIKFRL